MDVTQQFQYQVKTEPVSTAKETVTESRWHQPWSEPVRKRVIATALMAPALFFVQAVFQENVNPDKWFKQWQDPVRVKQGLSAANQQAYFAEPFGQTSPETTLESKWHYPWSEPVRLKPGLRAALQQPFTTDTRWIPDPRLFLEGWYARLSEPVRVPKRVAWQQAITQDYTIPSPATTLQGWYNWFSEPQRFKLALRPFYQQTFTVGLPSFITAILDATETPDVMAATLFEAASVSGAIVSIIEIVPKYANISTSYPAATYANVSIIEISS